MADTIPCMGGFCVLRDRCAHFHAGSTGRLPSERLCLPKRDGVSDVTEIRWMRLPNGELPLHRGPQDWSQRQ